MIQPQINSLVVARQFDSALKLLDNNKNSYGERNRLLYLLDYGAVLHYAKRYQESTTAFEEAKRVYDELYTVSLTNEGGTWLINDNVSPYRGEDFERVMVNIYQAMNFVMMGNIDEALVEARDVDLKLSLINGPYNPDQKNIYKEDAFARLWMGILYEAAGGFSNVNDAYISYKKAVEVYSKDYLPNYNLSMPRILKENILAAAEAMGDGGVDKYRSQFRDVPYVSLKEKSQKCEVYLIHYNGLSPIKHETAIPVPLPGGYVTALAFPQYDTRVFDTESGVLKLKGNSQSIQQETEVVEDIGAIAVRNLKNRQRRVIAKAVLRAGGKYLLELVGESAIEEHHGNTPGWFKYLSNLYNLTSQQPDLRSWQTLPDQIRMARVIVEPGDYDVFFNNESLGKLHAQAGTKKFFTVRTSR